MLQIYIFSNTSKITKTIDHCGGKTSHAWWCVGTSETLTKPLYGGYDVPQFHSVERRRAVLMWIMKGSIHIKQDFLNKLSLHTKSTTVVETPTQKDAVRITKYRYVSQHSHFWILSVLSIFYNVKYIFVREVHECAFYMTLLKWIKRHPYHPTIEIQYTKSIITVNLRLYFELQCTQVSQKKSYIGYIYIYICNCGNLYVHAFLLSVGALVSSKLSKEFISLSQNVHGMDDKH